MVRVSSSMVCTSFYEQVAARELAFCGGSSLCGRNVDSFEVLFALGELLDYWKFAKGALEDGPETLLHLLSFGKDAQLLGFFVDIAEFLCVLFAERQSTLKRMRKHGLRLHGQREINLSIASLLSVAQRWNTWRRVWQVARRDPLLERRIFDLNVLRWEVGP